MPAGSAPEAPGTRHLSFDEYGGTAPENYQRYFVPQIAAPIAADLIDAARLRPGDRVLDVACGTGIVARMAAERVGPDGSVAALDLNPGMLEVARGAAAALPIDWREGRAELMPLPSGAFDVVLSQFSLQFFSDRSAAVGEMCRVLASGGRIVLNLPGPMPALFGVLETALGDHLPDHAAAFVRAVFSLHDDETLRQLLAAAGFQQIVASRALKRLRLPSPIDFLWQYVWSTPLVNAASTLDPDQRRQLETDVLQRSMPFVHDGSLIVDLPVLTVAAQKP